MVSLSKNRISQYYDDDEVEREVLHPKKDVYAALVIGFVFGVPVASIACREAGQLSLQPLTKGISSY
jgi:hypothetical protein